MTRQNIEPYETLGNAVILKAVDDYRDAVKKLKKKKNNQAALEMKDECTLFFLSKHFNAFTTLDGKMLLDKLQKEVDV